MPRQGATLGIYEKSYTPVKWRMFQYVSPVGRCVIDDWKNSFTAASVADLDTFLRNIVKKPKWTYPDIGGLTGKHLKGLYEIRWKSENNVPYRIGGYFASEHEFVMLIGWTHNKKKYDPPSALETILQRKKKLSTGEATLCEYPILTGRAA